jgi:NAD(P)-dependent dehydrogenase (short-subunit alcohol dehydrogenase family)
MGKLDGKIALITGGSEGMGLATAQRFIAEGAEHVFITGRRQEMLDEAVKTMDTKKVTAIRADASKMADLDIMYNVIEKGKGRLDIVFANAGIGTFVPLGSITEKQFDELFNINVKGVLFTVQKVLPLMSDGGSVILNGSVSSIKGLAATSLISASKAAVRSFARCWTVDLKERKIRVNTLSPGAIPTSGWDKTGFSEDMKKTITTSLLPTIPMNRFGTSDEIAKAAVFLASDDSSYITGIELFVDGGMGQI